MTFSVQTFGQSVSGAPLLRFDWSLNSPKKHRVLILGGTHGNEVEGVIAAETLVGRLIEKNPFKMAISIVPNLNPDGVFHLTRVNGNGVDLNRNMPTKDWNPKALDPKYPPGPNPGSEPETKAVIRLLESFKPSMVFSLHSFSNFMLNTNGDCEAVAKAIQKVCGYKIEASIGYPTPGSLGTYCGVEGNTPCLTYEIERGLEFKKIIDVHVPALWAGIEFLENDQ